MMPLEGVQDLLVSALPEVPTSAIFEVRPYASGDRVSVFLKHLKNIKWILTKNQSLPGRPAYLEFFPTARRI